MASSHSRITQLDGLRACAIVAVFLHHAYHFKLLWMGVDLFFVLSGFLITGILVNQKNKTFSGYIGHFYERRMRRILPPYVMLLLLVALFFPGAWLHYWYLYIGGMNFLKPLGLPSPEYLSPLWSLAVEEQFYLVWPLFVFALDRRQLIRCAWAILLLAPLLRFVCSPFFHTSWPIYMLLPFRMDTLAAGALIALMWPAAKQRLAQMPALVTRIEWACLAGAILSFVCIGYLNRHGYSTYGNSRFGNLFIYETTLGLMTSVFLAVLVGFGRYALSRAPIVWLGRISYSFYLVHLVALSLVPQFHALLALALSLGYATLSWYLIEKPILNHGRPEPAIPR